MKRFLALIALVFVAVFAWRIGSMLSTDALGMAVGMVFGMLAGVPAALLVLATGRRREAEVEHYEYVPGRQGRQDRALPAYPYQPPVIVVTGGSQPHYPTQPHAPALPGDTAYYQASNWPARDATRPARQFKVVGEREDWLQ